VEVGGFSFAKDAGLAARIVRDVKRRTTLPVIAKLAPNVTDITEIARAVACEGADILSLINTTLGMAIDWRARRPVLGGVHGGFSGPALKPIALYQVYTVACASSLPLIGIGGIETADDVLEFIAAGATAVQVGTATFRDPGVIARIIAQLPAKLQQAGLGHILELRGAALPAATSASH
jgi:dihydroorotate dehydrogenase (NAD+) catalytic subunit